MGYPVTHSLSPMIHRLFAQQYNIPLNYSCLEVTQHKLFDCLRRFIDQGGLGLNITSPLKEFIYSQVTHLSVSAKNVGAINTVTIKNGILSGDNTDGIGFIQDVTKRHSITITDKQIVILGAGGAVRGILPSILALKPQSVTLVNRDMCRAAAVAENFSLLGKIEISSYAALKSSSFDLMINATSAGAMQLLPPMPQEFNFNSSICYDLNYGANHEIFAGFARASGAVKVLNGLGMLVEQAAQSFYLWHNLHPATNHVLAQLQQKPGQISAVYNL